MTPTALVFASLSLSGLFANLSGALVVSDTTQATIAPALDRDGQATDFETLPLLDLHLEWPRSSALFGYGPRFLLRDAFEDSEWLLLHVVRVNYAYTATRSRFALTFTGNFGRDALTTSAVLLPAPPQPAANGEPDTPKPLALSQAVSSQAAEIRYTYSLPRWELSLAQSGQLSEQSLAELALAAPLDVRAAITADLVTGGTTLDLLSRQRVKTASELTSAGLSHVWTRRLRSSLQLSYGISGGLGDEAEVIVPQQRTASGSLGLIHALARRDELSTTASVQQTEVSNGTDHWVLSLSEGWNRRWSAVVTSNVAAGVTATSSKREDSDERDDTVEPLASAGLSAVVVRDRGTTLTLHAGSSVSPSVSPFTGELQTRVTGTGAAELRVDQATLSAEAEIAQTLPPDDLAASRVIGVGAEISQRVEEFLFLSARYRSVWQNADDGVALGIPGNRSHLWTAIFTASVVGPAVDF